MKSEVECAIKRMKSHKSPGTDGISAEIIKAGGEELCEHLHELVAMIWEEETMPLEWTKSIVVTLPKKGDLKNCSNYRTLSLINHLCKILLMIILKRLKARAESCLSEEQAGFRSDRSTIHQILILRLIAENTISRQGKVIYNCFIDFKKAFDTIKHPNIWAVLESYGIEQKLINIIKLVYGSAQAAVRVDGELGDWFRQEVGSRQGDPISPTIFIIYLERIVQRLHEVSTGVSVHGRPINYLCFADDIDLMEQSLGELQTSLDTICKDASDYGLKINVGKTKAMVFGNSTDDNNNNNLSVGSETIENVEGFVYLGSLLTSDNDCSKEIRRRIALASGTLGKFRKIIKNRQIRNQVKLQIIHVCIFSVLLYAAETWTLKKDDIRRLEAFEMRCYRQSLNIEWFDRITNTEVINRMQPRKRLIQMLIKRKLGLFGHVCRMGDDRLIKTTMLGMVDGTRMRGGQRRRWIDDIKDWSGMTLGQLLGVAADRRAWRNMVHEIVDTNGHQAHGD